MLNEMLFYNLLKLYVCLWYLENSGYCFDFFIYGFKEYLI